MSKSKIAIVVASSLSTWDKATLVKEVIDAVTDADGMALIIPSRTEPVGIEQIIDLVDGVVLVCPAECQGGFGPVLKEDEYAREFGRRALDKGFNAIRIVGDRNFFATDKEWQDMAFFKTCRLETLDLGNVEAIREEIKQLVNGAAMFTAARRLARGVGSSGYHVNSPVTHG